MNFTTRLVLIRHGATKWNEQGRYCGYKDPCLSRQGKAQVAKLGRSLKAVKFDKVYCSDLRRALQSSRIIFNGTESVKIKELREINFGVLEGMRHKDVMRKYGKIYENWIKDPCGNRVLKCEPIAAFKKRVKIAINKIVLLNPGKTVAIVCHGGVIGMFVGSLKKQSDFRRYMPSSASISIVECRNKKFRIKKFNETAHLGTVAKCNSS